MRLLRTRLVGIGLEHSTPEYEPSRLIASERFLRVFKPLDTICKSRARKAKGDLHVSTSERGGCSFHRREGVQRWARRNRHRLPAARKAGGPGRTADYGDRGAIHPLAGCVLSWARPSRPADHPL